MPVTINAKGTSVPYFTIGKGGSTIYQGSSDPSSLYTLKAGDVWFDKNTNSLKIWWNFPGSPNTNEWHAPRLGDILINDDLITSDSTSNIRIQPSIGNNLYLNAMKWPYNDGSSGQFLKTDGSGNLSWSFVNRIENGTSSVSIPSSNGDINLTSGGTLVAKISGTSMNITGSASVSGQLTSTVATGTAPFVVASNTRVNNLNVATAGTADIATILADSTNGLRIANPGGASYKTTSASITGALKIKLPVATFNSMSMLSFRLNIYEYTGNTLGKSRTLFIGGYNAENSAWYHIFASQVTMGGNDINVRFGSDGTSQCIWIGETDTTWIYPQVFLTDLQVGYVGLNTASWSTGWSISFPTSFDTVTIGPIIAAKPLNSQNYNSYSPKLDGTGATGDWNIDVTGSSSAVVNTVTGTNTTALVSGTMASNDLFRILIGGTANDAGYVEIATADNGNEPIYVRQYSNAFTTIARTLTLLDGNGDTIIPNRIIANNTSTRDKYRVWGDSLYCIGMQNSFTFGPLNNDYAMTFQMSDTNSRGFWWGDASHLQSQGAMALSTDGKLTVADSIRVGFGQSDTTIPGATYKLEVNGAFAATTKSFLIDHPTKQGKKLQYGSLESPYHGVRLTGQATLKGKICKIELPEYIRGLCKQEGSQVQITNIRHGKVLWVEDIIVDENYFTISCDRKLYDKKEYDFYWSFTAIRKDIDELKVEVE